MSYVEAKEFDKDAHKVTCGCSGEPSDEISAACISPPQSPKPLIKSISSRGIDIVWHTAKEYGNAKLSGYLLQVNDQFYGTQIPSHATSATLTGLRIGADYNVRLIALTDHPVGNLPTTRATFDNTIEDGTDRPISNSSQYLSETSDDIIYSLMSAVKQSRETEERSESYLEGYQSCQPGPTTVINYNALVLPPDNVQLNEVLGTAAQLSWSFPNSQLPVRSVMYVRPEIFSVNYWLSDQHPSEAVHVPTKGTRMTLTDLLPGTDYHVTVSSKAGHLNQSESIDPLQPYLCVESCEVISFRTAHPPVPPTEFSIIGGTTKSLKLAWNEPIARGLKVLKYLLSVAGPVEEKNMQTEEVNPSSTMENLQVLPRIYDLQPDTVIHEVKNLVERTEYTITLYMITAHSNTERIRDLYESSALSSPQEILADDMWTPSVVVNGCTAGIDVPQSLHVTQREANSVHIEWTPAKAYGMYRLLHNIIRWKEIGIEEPPSMTTWDKQLSLATKTSGSLRCEATECKAVLENLYPGTNLEVKVESCFTLERGYVMSVDSDGCFGNDTFPSTPEVCISEVATSNIVNVWTRAPVASPRLLVRTIGNSEFELSWDRPMLLDLDTETTPNDEAAGTIRRSLLGYRLEINFNECVILSPSSTSYTFSNPKPGQSYNFQLAAVTTSQKNIKERRTKWQELMAGQYSRIYSRSHVAIDYPSEDVDEGVSDVVSVNVPITKDVVAFEAIACKYSKHGKKEKEATEHHPGVIFVRFRLSGLEVEIDEIKVLWSCHSIDGSEEYFEETLSYDVRGYEILNPKPKSVYTVRAMVIVEKNSQPITISSQAVSCQIPGQSDPPHVACRSISKNGFTLEWNEPQTYGGNEVGGYHVFVNGMKMDSKFLPATCRSCTVPCRAGRTYKVRLTAVSADPGVAESDPSNELLVNTHSELFQQNSPSTRSPRAAILDVNVASVYDNAVELEWVLQVLGNNEIIESFTVEWSCVAQPVLKSCKLPGSQQDYVMKDLVTGSSYFVVVTGFDLVGNVLVKSQQVTIQTSAAIETPVLRVGTCTGKRLDLEWTKPKTYGDATIDKYQIKLDGSDYAEVGKEQNSYSFTSCEPCQKYSFSIMAISSKTGYNSAASQPITLTCPGAQASNIYRVKTPVANSVKVSWKKPSLFGGAKLKAYWVYYAEALPGKFKISPEEILSDAGVIVHGPLSRYTLDDSLTGINPCSMYHVVVQVDLEPEDCPPIFSTPLRTKAAMPPNPPHISAQVLGMEQRLQLEGDIEKLVSQRDRLCREINVLRGLVVIKHLSDRDEEISRLSQNVDKLDTKLQHKLKDIKKYTGKVEVQVKWSFPGHDGDAVATGYRVFVNGNQYGKDLPIQTKTAILELSCSPTPHEIRIVTTTSHPVGDSPDSNVIKISTRQFIPFPFFCYFNSHVRGNKYPAPGCCNYADTHALEEPHKHDKPGRAIPYKGVIAKRIPHPAASGQRLDTGGWQQIVEPSTNRPTILLFWTKWCQASLHLMNFFLQYADMHEQDFNFVTCCTHSGESSQTHLTKLRDTFQNQAWTSNDLSNGNVRHLCICEQRESDARKAMALSGSLKMSTTADLFGIVGVPSISIVNSQGNIAWQGRYCALDYFSFDRFIKHVRTKVLGTSCDNTDCPTCLAETHQDFSHEITSDVPATNQKPSKEARDEMKSKLLMQNLFPKTVDGRVPNRLSARPSGKRRSRGDGKRHLSSSMEFPLSSARLKSSVDRSPLRHTIDVPYEKAFMQELLNTQPNGRYSSSLFPRIKSTAGHQHGVLAVPAVGGNGHSRTKSTPIGLDMYASSKR